MAKRYYRKAQGLSLNTIIIAAIGLAVLVILFAVFTGRIGNFNEGVDSAQRNILSCNAICDAAGFDSGDELGQNQQCAGSVRSSSGGDCCCTNPSTGP